MSGQTDPECTCRNSKNQLPQKHNRICLKCEQTFNIKMDDLHRKLNCKQHRLVLFCGIPPYTCDECADEG